MHDYLNRCFINNGERIELTLNENEILYTLIKHKNEIVRYKDFLLNKKALRIAIKRLRDKIPSLRIITKRFYGYMLLEGLR